MTYLSCPACRFTRASHFGYFHGSCPRCRSRGKAVELVEIKELVRDLLPQRSKAPREATG